MKNYIAYIDDGSSVFKITIPARDEREAKTHAQSYGEVVSVREVEGSQIETRVERIRTMRGAVEYFRALDGKTAITEGAIRRALMDGKIPYATTGKKYLVSIDAIERYFSGLMVGESCLPERKNPGIRPVKV